MRLFIELVDAKFGLNAFKIKLGMSAVVVKNHLKRIDEYRLTIKAHDEIEKLKQMAKEGKITNIELLKRTAEIKENLDGKI